MLNQVYRLVSERRFESFVISERFKISQVVIKPEYLSICHADQRYYGFHRDPSLIKKKLPMALIHEGMGRVVSSFAHDYLIGDRVTVVPNIVYNPQKEIGGNYLESSGFMSSNTDGLMREYVVVNADQIVKVPDSISDQVASFTEMISVGHQAITRMFKKTSYGIKSIGIWGDGNVSYMTAAILKKLYPDIKIYVFGHHQFKLDYFSFVDATFLTDTIPNNLKIDAGIEATGGRGVHDALNQIIMHINPEGVVTLMGVSEDEVPINTRMILQKGLTFVGSSRSVKEDFISVTDLLANDKILEKRMEILVDRIINVNSIQSAVQAFEYDENQSFGKTILRWNI